MSLIASGKEKLHEMRFERFWRKHSDFPGSLNLSLTTACNADCVFCPERGVDIVGSSQMMSFDLVMDILDQARANGFTGSFSLSENGEGILHPRFREIVTALRERFPDNEVVLFSNMVRMTADLAEFLLRKDLSYLHFNIDGATGESYESVKQTRGKYERVLENVRTFLALRREMDHPCRVGVNVVTAHDFASQIEGRQDPPPDDFELVRQQLLPWLRPGEKIERSVISLEKFQFVIKRERREPCDLYNRVLNEMFIAPTGQVYICCSDFGVRSSLGNLKERSIAAVWSGEARKEAIQALYARDFGRALRVCQTCIPSRPGVSAEHAAGYEEARKQVQVLFQSGKARLSGGRLQILP